MIDLSYIIQDRKRGNMIVQNKLDGNDKLVEIKSTPKIWAQDLLMDLLSTYNYKLEDRGMHNLDKMTKKEEEQCMEQLRKQADRIAKLFGFKKHWTT